jgi:hypothetical protein
MFRPPGQCPVCHEFVPRKAVACPDCGACAKSGWNEDNAHYDGVDVPDDPADFDYDDFTRREFGSAQGGAHRKPWWWWVAVVLLILGLAVMLTQV